LHQKLHFPKNLLSHNFLLYFCHPKITKSTHFNQLFSVLFALALIAIHNSHFLCLNPSSCIPTPTFPCFNQCPARRNTCRSSLSGFFPKMSFIRSRTSKQVTNACGDSNFIDRHFPNICNGIFWGFSIIANLRELIVRNVLGKNCSFLKCQNRVFCNSWKNLIFLQVWRQLKTSNPQCQFVSQWQIIAVTVFWQRIWELLFNFIYVI
jgi:hypothetical protein